VRTVAGRLDAATLAVTIPSTQIPSTNYKRVNLQLIRNLLPQKTWLHRLQLKKPPQSRDLTDHDR
jgi:hypothetical protein